MGDNIAIVGPMCAESDGEKFTWWHFHCKEMMGLELLWEGAICGDGGICGKVHLEAFSLERKEAMGILFKRGLQRPLEGDNGLPF